MLQGHKVRCLIHYNFLNSNGWLDTLDKRLKNIEIIPGDIRDKDLIEKSIDKNTNAIFNLAALIGILILTLRHSLC